MSRYARVQYPNAIYHVMSRGNRRQDIVIDDHDRQHFWDRLAEAVVKFGWLLFAAVLLDNHFHLFLKTPEPNLSHGMQWLLGGYASWWNNRHQRTGHVFQARYKGEVVENNFYFWTLSRYVHRNPCPWLAAHPALYPWSTYASYIGLAPRLPWVAYDEVLASWQGEFGGTDVLAAYRQFVEADLVQRVKSPFIDAIDGWILGSDQFAEQVRALISPDNHEPSVDRLRRPIQRTLDELLSAVCDYYQISPGELARRGSRHPARPALALLAKQHSAATLTQLAQMFGLARRDCVPNLIRRANLDPAITLDIGVLVKRLELTTNHA